MMEYFLAKRVTAARKRIPSLNRRAFDFLLSCDSPSRMRDLENLGRKIVAFGKTCESRIPQEKKRTRPKNAVSRFVPRQGERRPLSGHWNALGEIAAWEIRVDYRDRLINPGDWFVEGRP